MEKRQSRRESSAQSPERSEELSRSCRTVRGPWLPRHAGTRVRGGGPSHRREAHRGTRLASTRSFKRRGSFTLRYGIIQYYIRYMINLM